MAVSPLLLFLCLGEEVLGSCVSSSSREVRPGSESLWFVFSRSVPWSVPFVHLLPVQQSPAGWCYSCALWRSSCVPRQRLPWCSLWASNCNRGQCKMLGGLMADCRYPQVGGPVQFMCSSLGSPQVSRICGQLLRSMCSLLWAFALFLCLWLFPDYSVMLSILGGVTQNWTNAAKSHRAGEAGWSLHSHFPDGNKCGPKRPSLALGGWGHTGQVKLYSLQCVCSQIFSS